MKTLFLSEKSPAGLKLHFNLKQMKDSMKLTQIMLVTTVNKHRIRVYTKLRVEPNYWDKVRNRCLSENTINLRERTRLSKINKQLDKLVTAIWSMDEKLAVQGKYLSQDAIRKVVEEQQRVLQTTTAPIAYLYQQVDEYLKNVNRRGKRGIATTKKTYYTAMKRLEAFCKHKKLTVRSFDDFDKKFFSDFINYLYSFSYQRGGEYKHYTQNTIVNTLKVIKNLLHRAYDNEMTDNNYFLRIQTTLTADVSELVYLTEKEIRKLASVKVEEPSEKHIRDLFVIACYTALRISDIQKLNDAVFQNDRIVLYQTKTKEQVEIPILKEIVPLISYYRSKGFPVIDLYKANDVIKQLAKRCGIDETVNCKENRGGEITVKKLPKWKLISFHTARRSCITNLYKRGYPPNYIMTLSGHRSMQAFQRYVRASSKEMTNHFVTLLKKNRAL